MTTADLAALAAAGLTRFAEGRLAEPRALAVVLAHASDAVGAAADDDPQPDPCHVEDAVARLKRDLRR